MVTLALIIAIASVAALYLDAITARDTGGHRTEADALTGTTYVAWGEIEVRLLDDEISVSVCSNGARLVRYPILFRQHARGCSFVPSSVRSRADLVRWVAESCWPDRSIEQTIWHVAPKRSSVGSSILVLRSAILEIFDGFCEKAVVNRAARV